MARPKKDSGKTAGNLTHDNTTNALTDDETKALTFQHVKKYRAALAAKKESAAAFLNATKLAKAELGDDAIKDIKQIIAAEDDENYEEKFKAEIERQARVSRWLGLEIGAQPDIFSSTVSPPVVEKAYEDGKTAGLKGEVCAPPNGSGPESYSEYVRGWHDGQAALASMIKKKEAAETPLISESHGDDVGPDAFDEDADSDLTSSDTSEPLGDGAAADDDPEVTASTAKDPWPDDEDVAAKAEERESAEVL